MFLALAPGAGDRKTSVESDLYTGMGGKEGLFCRKDWKSSATWRTECEGQIHKIICRETVLVVLCGGKYYAVAIMDRIGGWEQEGQQKNWLGPRFATNMWIFSKAVVCNGQNHMKYYGMFKLRFFMEAVNCVCVTTLLTSTCGCHNRPCRCFKQKKLEALQ